MGAVSVLKVGRTQSNGSEEETGTDGEARRLRLNRSSSGRRYVPRSTSPSTFEAYQRQSVIGGYSRLDEGIEFDRGSKCTRIRQSIQNAVAYFCRWIFFLLIQLLRKCGFLIDNVDFLRVSQRRMGEPEEVFWYNAKLGTAAVALVFITALEPILLKVMSDHAMVEARRDYRYVLSLLIILSHLPLAIVSAVWYAIKYSPTAKESCDFPKTWFVLLALLNALHLLMLFIPSAAVPGPLTVLLVHGQVPITHIVSVLASVVVFLINYFFPTIPDPAEDSSERELSSMEVMLQSQYGNTDTSRRSNDPFARYRSSGFGGGVFHSQAEQGVMHRTNGQILLMKSKMVAFFKTYLCSRPRTTVCAVLICLGSAVGMYPVFTKDEKALGKNSYCFVFNNTCLNSTILFFLSAVPAALSAICLERTLVTYSVPVPPLLLHAWLVPMQFLFGVLLAPVGRHFQHPSRKFVNISYELRELDVEVERGLRCILLGEESGVDLSGLSDPDWCKPLLPLLIMFVAVSFSFHMLTLYVMKRGTEVCLRLCTAVAVPFAWGVLAYYDLHFQPNVSDFVPTQIVISHYSKIAMICVTFGILFHKTISEPGTDFILTSPVEERDRLQIEASSEQHRRMLMQAKAQQQQGSDSTDGFLSGFSSGLSQHLLDGSSSLIHEEEEQFEDQANADDSVHTAT